MGDGAACGDVLELVGGPDGHAVVGGSRGVVRDQRRRCEQRSGDSHGDGDAGERCAGARGVEAGALAYTENDVATVVSATITVSDLDLTTDANLDTATVTISTG